jgi:hypothetical protein
MTRNLLFSEYSAELSKAAALYGAEGGAILSRDAGARWVGAASRVEFGLDLYPATVRGSFVPDVKTATSGSLPRDALMVLVYLDDAHGTLMRAVSALATVRDCIVWFDRAPCDSCGKRGNNRGTPCERCNATGYRNETPTPEPSP